MYRVIWVDKFNDHKRDVELNSRDEAIALAEDYDGNAASKTDSVYVYEDDKIIWINGYEIPEGA